MRRYLGALFLTLAVGCGAPSSSPSSSAPQLPLSASVSTVGPSSPHEPGASPSDPAPSHAPGSGTRAPGATRPCERPTLIGQVVTARVSAHRRPSLHAPVVGSFARKNPQGSPQVFDLMGRSVDQDGHVWFRALLPVRPNGTTGFVRATRLSLSETGYRLVVDRARLRLTVWQGCRKVRVFSIGLGKGSTPTPVGRFYLAALMKPPTPGSVYGVYAYGLSAYSDVLTDWEGGGIIGLHGTNDPSSIGRRMSHGCIRMRNRDIVSLVRILPLGTPVTII